MNDPQEKDKPDGDEEEDEDIDDLLDDYQHSRSRRQNVRFVKMVDDLRGGRSDTQTFERGGSITSLGESPVRRNQDQSPHQTFTGSFTGDSRASFQGSKGDVGEKSRLLKSFAPSNYEANWMHLGGDVMKKLPRKGSFEVDLRRGPKDEGVKVFDYILHKSELIFGEKLEGKPLINGYMEMDHLRSSDIASYMQMLDAGVLLEPPEEITEMEPADMRAIASASFTGSDSDNVGSFAQPGPDQDTLDMLENYVEEEPEQPQEKIYENFLPPMDVDENTDVKAQSLIFENIFVKFDNKGSVFKKANRVISSKQPSMEVKVKPQPKVVVTKEQSPVVSREEISPTRKRTLSNQGNKDLLLESDKKSEMASSFVEEDSAKKESDSASQPTGGDSFINQDDKTDIQEESKSLNDDLLLKKENSLKVPESPTKISSFKDDQIAGTPKASTETLERKDTIKVLSKFDEEEKGNNANFTLGQMIARNANQDRRRSMEQKKEKQIKRTHSIEALASKGPQDYSKLPVPEDSLDAFDRQDELASEISPSLRGADCFVVTKNPLISSYTVKITDVVPCPSLTKELYDTETSKKSYEPTFIKYAPPEFILVGTTLSTVLMFDGFEKLKYTIKYNEGPKQAVTALDYTLEDPELPILVVGFSGGHIGIFDFKTNALVKAITNVHTSKITSIKIYQGSGPLKFICCDESGEIYSYQLKKLWKIYKEEHKLVLKDIDTFTFEAEVLPKELRILCSSTLQEQEYLSNLWFLAKVDGIFVLNQNPGSDGKPSNAIEWSLKRPGNVSLDLLPSISFGKGIGADGKRINYFLAGWGTILHMVTFYLEGGKAVFQNFGYFELKNNIQVATWISDDTIVVLDHKGEVYLVSLEEFIQAQYEETKEGEIQSEQEQKPKAFIYEFGVEKGLKSNIKFTNYKKISWVQFKSSVTTSTAYHQVLMMCERKMQRMKIVSAPEYLDILLREKDWLKFLTIALQMYQFNIKEFHSIPFHPENRRRFFLPYFQDRISKYLYETLGNKENTESYCKEFILSLIDFLIAVDDTEFLFGHCFRKITEAGYQTLFIEVLEPFIEANYIKKMTDDSLRFVVTYYCQQGKQNLMQILISHVDLTHLEPFSLMNLCLEQNLYTSLIDVCAKTEGNYITPFVKMINDYNIAKRNRNNEETPNNGFRCLWYLRLCLEKKIVPDSSEENTEKWKNIISQFTVMIFAPENLQILFEIDPALVTCFMILFFRGELEMVVQENYGRIILGNIKPGSAEADNLHYQIYKIVKQVLSTWVGSERNSFYTQYFGFFLGTLADMLQYSFLDRDLCVDFADLYINQPTLLSEKLLLLWEKSRLREEGKTPQEIAEFFAEKVDYDFVAEKRISIILGLLRYSQYTLTKVQTESLIQKSQASNLIDIECFLLALNGSYKQCLDTYLSNRATPDIKRRVFSWIDETFRASNDKVDKTDMELKAIDDFKHEIISKFKQLLKIDSDKTKHVIDTFLGDKILLVVNSPNLKADFKLDILEKCLRKPEKNLRVEEKVLELHIQLLAESSEVHRRKIKQILQESNEYPLDFCLNIAKKYSIKDAWAYLEFKQGNITAAIHKSFELFIDTLKKGYIQEGNPSAQDIDNTLLDLIEYLGQNTISAESSWFKVVIDIFKFFEDHTPLIQQEELRDDFKKRGNHVVDQMLDNIFAGWDSRELMRTVEQHYDQFPGNLKRIVLIKLIFHHVHEEFILNSCKKLLCTDVLQFINIQLLSSQAKGQHNFPVCGTCNKNFKQYDYTIWFNCGHIYHSTQACCPEGKCQTCQASPHAAVQNTVRNKMSRGAKTHSSPSKNLRKENADDEEIEVGRSRAATRTFKDSEDQYNNEKASYLNRHWNRKNQRQQDINDFAEKYLS